MSPVRARSPASPRSSDRSRTLSVVKTDIRLKRKSRNVAQIFIAVPEVLRFFGRFVRTYFNVSDEKFRVTCNLFADHLERQREIEQFWLDTLELPRESLCRSIVNVYSKYSPKKRKNRLPHGTRRLSVHSTAVVQSIFGAIQEYGAFERPEWLG